jgi:hypothetical protein
VDGNGRTSVSSDHWRLQVLTTRVTIVTAGVLLVLAALAHTMLPRYEVRPLEEFGVFVRIDRWRGTADIALMTDTPRWLTVNGKWRIRLGDGRSFDVDEKLIEELQEKPK